jgi:hypothetical protein
MSEFTEVNVLHDTSEHIPRGGGQSPFIDDLEDVNGIPQSPVEVTERGVVAGGSSTIWDASFNFINSIVGAGIIGIVFSSYFFKVVLSDCVQ